MNSVNWTKRNNVWASRNKYCEYFSTLESQAVSHSESSQRVDMSAWRWEQVTPWLRIDPTSSSRQKSKALRICPSQRGINHSSPPFNPRSSHTKDIKMVLDAASLNTQHYKVRIKWSNPRRGIAPYPKPQCSSYWKGSLRVTLDYGRLYFYIWVLLPSLFIGCTTIFHTYSAKNITDTDYVDDLTLLTNTAAQSMSAALKR